MRNIAVIPARSGSKGLKDKNIKELCGKPLLAYSIEAAKESGLFACIHVSTDSEEYARIARVYGADVPFLRDEKNSSDTASTWEAMRFVVKEYEKLGKSFDTLTVLQPTSPLRTADDIKGAMETFMEKKANLVSTVCQMDHSPLWSNTLPEDNAMDDFEDEKIAMLPRQSLPTYYRENGAIYICNTNHLFNATNIYKPNSYAYIMNQRKSIDIDSEFDFRMAEFLIKEHDGSN